MKATFIGVCKSSEELLQVIPPLLRLLLLNFKIFCPFENIYLKPIAITIKKSKQKYSVSHYSLNISYKNTKTQYMGIGLMLLMLMMSQESPFYSGIFA